MIGLGFRFCNPRQAAGRLGFLTRLSRGRDSGFHLGVGFYLGSLGSILGRWYLGSLGSI